MTKISVSNSTTTLTQVAERIVASKTRGNTAYFPDLLFGLYKLLHFPATPAAAKSQENCFKCHNFHRRAVGMRQRSPALSVHQTVEFAWAPRSLRPSYVRKTVRKRGSRILNTVLWVSDLVDHHPMAP